MGVTGQDVLQAGTSLLKGGVNLIRGTKDLFARLFLSLENISNDFDTAAVEMARHAGVSREKFDTLSREMVSMVSRSGADGLTLIQKYGRTATEFIKMKDDFQAAIGRNISLSEDQLGKYAALESQLGQNGTQIAQAFMNFGMDITSTEKVMSEIMNEAVADGVRMDKVTANIRQNMERVMSYTFENGVRGFTSMAERAAEVNLNMGEALRFADKIKDISSAIQVGSKLQVLGGQFASLSNPLEMFYEATSDVGALQERMINMFKGLGTYNRETNQVTLSRFNRMRVQTAAQEMGISADEMFKMINTSAMKDEVLRQMSSVTGISDKQRNYIANTATINDKGQAVVTINGEEKQVSKLNGNDIKALQMLSNTATTAQSINQIAIDVHTIAQNKNLERGAVEVEGLKDFYRNPKEILEGFGSYIKTNASVFSSVFGGDESTVSDMIQTAGNVAQFGIDAAGNFVQDKAGEISQWLGSIAGNVQQRLSNNTSLNSEERAKAASLAEQANKLANIVANGGSMRDITQQWRVGIEGNQLLAKGQEISDVLTGKGLAENVAGIRKDTNKMANGASKAESRANGGAISVPAITAPHAEGGWMMPNLLNGGLITEGAPAGVEFPISRQYDNGGVFENTAQINEYVINPRSTMKNLDVLTTINSNPNAEYGLVEKNAYANGGIVSVPHVSGGELTGNIGGNISMGDSTITLKFDGTTNSTNIGLSDMQKREILDMVKKMFRGTKFDSGSDVTANDVRLSYSK